MALYFMGPTLGIQSTNALFAEAIITEEVEAGLPTGVKIAELLTGIRV